MNLAQKEAVALACRKLRGEQLKQAKGFIFNRGILGDDRRLSAFVSRLEALPDVDVDPADRRVMRTLTDREIRLIKERREAGAGLKELSEQFHVSMSTISRCFRGAGAYEGADE